MGSLDAGLPESRRVGGRPGLSDQPALRLGVVVAVRNEAKWLDGLFESLMAQEGLETVCCIAAVDGRSEDDSRLIIERWENRLRSLRLLDNAARIAPVAFNLGIHACLDAGAEAVLLVSGHSSLHPGFLATLQRQLEDPSAGIVGCIHDYPPAATRFEAASQAFAESRLGRRLGSFSRLKKPQETEIAFCPTFRREVFEKVGFFDETMVRNQDIDFTTRARAAGFRIVTSPELKDRYSPPGTFGRLVKQMYGNGLWVGRRVSSHGWRHVAPSVFYAALIASATLAIVPGPLRPFGAAALATLACSYLLAIVLAALAWMPAIRLAALWLPAVFLCTHGAYAVGTFRGLLSAKGSR